MDTLFSEMLKSVPLSGVIIYGLYMYFKHWRPAVKSSGNGTNNKEFLRTLNDILIAINAQNAAKRFDTEQIKNLKSMVAELQGSVTELRVEVAKHGERT